MTSGSGQSSFELPASTLDFSSDDSLMEELFDLFQGDDDFLDLGLFCSDDEPAMLSENPAPLPPAAPPALAVTPQPALAATPTPVDDMVAVLSFSLFRTLPESLPPTIRSELAAMARTGSGVGATAGIEIPHMAPKSPPTSQ